MALNTRLSAPSYKIYEPDALDVALSNRVLDPLQGGIAGAMLLAHGIQNENAQKQYLADSGKFNIDARNLDAMEIAQKSHEARLKLAPGMMEHGINAGDIIGIEDLLRPGGIQSNDAAALFRAKTMAEIGAHNRSGGSGGGVKEQTTETSAPLGSDSVIQHRYSGPPRNPVAPVDPTVSTPIPNNNPNAAKAGTAQIIQRAAAAVGANDPSQLGGGRDTSGNFVFKNTASGKTATFDSSGKQLR